MAWQKATGYGRRSLIETAIGRYKSLIGPRLRARTLAAQQGEIAIAVEGLNPIIRVAKPSSVRIALSEIHAGDVADSISMHQRPLMHQGGKVSLGRLRVFAAPAVGPIE